MYYVYTKENPINLNLNCFHITLNKVLSQHLLVVTYIVQHKTPLFCHASINTQIDLLQTMKHYPVVGKQLIKTEGLIC